MISGVTMKINIDEYLMNALKEDITQEDVSTNAVMPEPKQGEVNLICKQDGIICGLEVFERVFKLLDDTVVFETELKDGDQVTKGQLMGVVKGDIRALLSGERVALNYLQRMSGIATMTSELAKELEGYKTKLLDTRKTTPNMRPFEKYAVTVGGGHNHRYNLSDGVMLKDNHIGAAGGIKEAVAMAKDYAPFVRKIEVETENLDMVKEAVEAGADIIMLDNMDDDTMKEADLLLHVVDSSFEDYQLQVDTTNKVLEELGVENTPMIYVYNKVDLNKYGYVHPVTPYVFISAKEKIGLGLLEDEISHILFKDYETFQLGIPYDKGEDFKYLYENTYVEQVDYRDDYIYLQIEAKRQDIKDYLMYILLN